MSQNVMERGRGSKKVNLCYIMNKWPLRLNDLFNIKDFENEEIISQFVEVIKFCDQSGDKGVSE